MATSDIAKQSVFDNRIIQQSPAFAVNKGALSLTAVPFRAIGESTTQHTYNCPIPSQNIFIDRAVDWESTFTVRCDVAPITVPRGANEPILSLGKDVAFTSFPLHSMTQTMTATINDTTVTMNTQDVLKEVIRLTSLPANRKSRTCPTHDDMYVSHTDAYLTNSTALGGYGEAYDVYNVGNGAYPLVRFCRADGTPLVGSANYVGDNGIQVDFVNGIPIRTALSDANTVNLYLQITSTEKLVLSPFIFANSHEWDTGLFGINAIQFVMNLGSPSRVLRSAGGSGRIVSNVVFPPQDTTPFTDSRVLFQFLTPSLDVPLPPKSVVPYMEFPRYITNVNPGAVSGSQNGGLGQDFTIQSQTIVLPQIPDMLIIYARPQSYGTNTTLGDYHFPPSQISLNFDNFAGLLSAHRQTQLYQMAVHNGLDMDYASWTGRGYTGRDGRAVPLVGGYLVLRPGVDFALQSGQAPGLAGNFVLQYNITLRNTTGADLGAGDTVSLYTVAVNAGFFESMAGSSRVIKAVVSEADIISAEPAGVGSQDALKRVVGSGFFDNLGSVLGKLPAIYSATKPVISALKPMAPGKVGSVLGALGYGATGGAPGVGMSGGAPGSTGGQRGHSGGKKSLASRLM